MRETNARLWRPAAALAAFLGLFLLVGLLAGAGEVVGNLANGSVKDQHVNAAAGIQASKLATRSLANFPQSLLALRKWDALEQLLPASAATTYLGLVTGTYGTNPPQAQTGDLKAAGATTRRARTLVILPDNFVASGNITIRCNAGMKTTVADTSATVLVEAYQLNDDGTLSANLVTTAAQSINSLTYANKDFALTTTGLVAGSRLDVRVSITVTDAASVTAVIGLLHDLVLRCDVQP